MSLRLLGVPSQSCVRMADGATQKAVTVTECFKCGYSAYEDCAAPNTPLTPRGVPFKSASCSERSLNFWFCSRGGDSLGTTQRLGCLGLQLFPPAVPAVTCRVLVMLCVNQSYTNVMSVYHLKVIESPFVVYISMWCIICVKCPLIPTILIVSGCVITLAVCAVCGMCWGTVCQLGGVDCLFGVCTWLWEDVGVCVCMRACACICVCVHVRVYVCPCVR